MTRRALDVRARYETFERHAFGRPWSVEELTLGLVGDIGDLAKLVQAHEGVRAIDDARRSLEHELADVLWSVIVIADRCDIDLAAAFGTTMDDLDARLAHVAGDA
jgi:NTP pyrophosphatase (non-canonical NTP hydrolase)